MLVWDETNCCVLVPSYFYDQTLFVSFIAHLSLLFKYLNFINLLPPLAFPLL